MTQRPAAQELSEMQELGAATLYEAQGLGALDPAIKPIAPAMRLAGPAFTVDLPAGDNLALHHALVKAEPGQIIIADYKACVGVAAWGELMSFAALQRGISGLVIDGALRDASAIAAMGFPAFCRGLCIVGPAKNQPGALNVPITCASTAIAPGDIIVADRDGVVVIAQDRWRDVLQKARTRQIRETAIRDGISAGKTTIELLGLKS